MKRNDENSLEKMNAKHTSAVRGSVGDIEPSSRHRSFWCSRMKKASAVMSVDEKIWLCCGRSVKK